MAQVQLAQCTPTFMKVWNRSTFPRYSNHPETLSVLWHCTSSDKWNLSSLGKCSIFFQHFFVQICDLFCQSARLGCTHGMWEELGAIVSRTTFFNPSRVWLLTTTYAAANVRFCQCNSLSVKFPNEIFKQWQKFKIFNLEVSPVKAS